MQARETFRWHYKIFDVAAINADLRTGQLSGCSVTLDRAVIEWYSRCGLGLEGAERIFPQVPEPNVEYAKTLSADRKIEPIVLVCFERAKVPESDLTAGLDVGGILNYDPTSGIILQPTNLEAANVVVIDGNHRVASAYFDGRDSLAGILILDTDLDRYLLDCR